MSDKHKGLVGFEIVAIKCFKCKTMIGCLEVPMENVSVTADDVIGYLVGNQICSCCMTCFNANPTRYDEKLVQEGT